MNLKIKKTEEIKEKNKDIKFKETDSKLIKENLIEKSQEKEQEKEKNYRKLTHCPYCKGKVVKRGIRKKKFEEIQIYYCKYCNKKLTPLITKNKTYPLRVIIDGITLYNKLYSFEEVAEKLLERYGINIAPQTISRWVKSYEEYTPFIRMREFASKNYSKRELIEESKLFHQQIYNFRYHRGKFDLIINENFKHYRFKPLREFLELAVVECPHSIFESSEKRASDYKKMFNLDQVKINSKENTATKIANFVIQAISNNKLRHEKVQEFMIINDSVTVASELAVLINSDDIRHFKHELKFEIPFDLDDGDYITGHIDLVQIRNGLIYLLDFKPSASKEKPIDQLTLYALALSRLTGIRLYHFKCAWFDDKNYYEFFPLHVVYKLKKRKKYLPRSQKKLETKNQ